MAHTKRQCQNCNNEFTIEPEDFLFYEKMKVPSPTFCWECRRQRRFAWRNLLNFHKRTCALTGVPVISLYPSDSRITVYSPKAWHSDKWSASDYGQDYDFSRPFFAQYAELVRRVPKPSTNTDDGLESINCMYTNDFSNSKDCYLVIKAWKLENVMYSFYVVSGKDLVDVHTSFGGDEKNYETVSTESCYGCRYLYDSSSSSECIFGYDLRGCSNCFMCTGLRSKSYYFKNEYVGKERYGEIIKEYVLHTYSGVERAKKEFELILKDYPRKALRTVNCKDCIGDLIYNSHDCRYCFSVVNSEHYKFGTDSDGVRDAYDTEAGGGSELIYECDVTAHSANIIGGHWAWQCQDSFYLDKVYRSKNCFGCSGLKDAQYCILNKQYSKEEYFDLLPRIKKHMEDMPYVDAVGRKYVFGDYPPIELSYFPYNESSAQSLYPLTKDEIQRQNFSWREPSELEESRGTVFAQNLPDSIFDVGDDIIEETILSASNRKYRIIPKELEFYRTNKIPLPRESFFERCERRAKLGTSFRLYHRKSDKSGEDIITSYPPDAPVKVWSIEEHRAAFD